MFAGGCQRERLAAALLGYRLALDQCRVREAGEELGDGCAGDSGPPRELGSRDALAGDRPQRQVLGHGQRRPRLEVRRERKLMHT